MRSPDRRLFACSLLLALCSCSGESAPPVPSAAARRAPAQAKPAPVPQVEPDPEVSSMLALATRERAKAAEKKSAPKAEVQPESNSTSAARKLPTATVASGPVDTAKLGSRGLLHWFPKDALFVLRIPHVESLGEIKRRTNVGALFQSPALALALSAASSPLGQLQAQIHSELPELETLIAKLPELKGELVLGLTHAELPAARPVPDLGSPKATLALAFDAGAGADELQRMLDPLLERLQREPQTECAKTEGGWGLIGWHAEASFEIRRFGNVFTALLGSDPDFTGRPQPGSDGPGFSGAALVASAADLNAAQQGVFELYLNADPAWELFKQRAGAEAQAVTEKLGLYDVHGVSMALGLGKPGMDESHTWCAPAHADVVSRVLAGAPAERELGRWIPADATTAALNVFDLHELYTTIVGLLPEPALAEWQHSLDDVKKHTRIDLVGDVFQNLGPSFALVARGDALAYLAGAPPMCVMVQTHDDDKVGALIGKLMPLLPPALKRRSSEFAGHAVLSFDLGPLGGGVKSVSLCRVDGALLIATDEALLDSCLLAGKEPGLKQRELAQALSAEGVLGASLTAGAGNLPATVAVLRKTERGLVYSSANGAGSLASALIAMAPPLAAVAIPKLMAARMDANETAAVALMHSIQSAEAQIQSTGILDLDHDGAGEYGSLAELAGATRLRGSGEFLQPVILPVDARSFSDGVLTRNGYHFVVYLPSSKKGTFCEPKARDGSDISAHQAEIEYIVQAWPVKAPETGRRVFVVDQKGDLVCCQNPACKYSGPEHRPACDAYLPAQPGVDRASGKPYTGRDGSTWVMVPDPRR